MTATCFRFGQTVEPTADPAGAIGAAVTIDGAMKWLPIAVVDNLLAASKPGGAMLGARVFSQLNDLGIVAACSPDGRVKMREKVVLSTYFKPATTH